MECLDGDTSAQDVVGQFDTVLVCFWQGARTAVERIISRQRDERAEPLAPAGQKIKTDSFGRADRIVSQCPVQRAVGASDIFGLQQRCFPGPGNLAFDVVFLEDFVGCAEERDIGACPYRGRL